MHGTNSDVGRGGSGLNFLGSGFWRLLKLKIGLEAFKIRALKTGLKIC
jgi:hypothetical protein